MRPLLLAIICLLLLTPVFACGDDSTEIDFKVYKVCYSGGFFGYCYRSGK